MSDAVYTVTVTGEASVVTAGDKIVAIRQLAEYALSESKQVDPLRLIEILDGKL